MTQQGAAKRTRRGGNAGAAVVPIERADNLTAPDIADLYVKYADEQNARLHLYRNVWREWRATHYRETSETAVRDAVVGWLRNTPAYRGFAIRHVVDNVMLNLRAAVRLSDRDAPFWIGDAEPPFSDAEIIPCANACVRPDPGFCERFIVPHTPDRFVTYALPIEYHGEQPCPRWAALLEHAMPDPALRDTFQEFAGYLLVPDTSHAKAALLFGPAHTGKSVLLTVVRALLGTANTSSLGLDAFDVANRFALAATDGKLANICAELRSLYGPVEEKLKAFISGDVVQIEEKYRAPRLMRPTARLLFATNTLPGFTDQSAGIWRRLLLFPMRVPVRPEVRDLSMLRAEFWAEELPGILHWALMGLVRLQAQGEFTESPAHREALEFLREESDPARVFFRAHFEEHEGAFISTRVMYSDYSTWCGREGYRPLARSTFGRGIPHAFPGARATRRNHGGTRGWIGIRQTASVAP